jgi:hypothetical protein
MIPFGPGSSAHLMAVANHAMRPVGLLLLVVGMVGLGLTAWAWGKRRRTGSTTDFDDHVRLPSYL